MWSLAANMEMLWFSAAVEPSGCFQWRRSNVWGCKGRFMAMHIAIYRTYLAVSGLFLHMKQFLELSAEFSSKTTIDKEIDRGIESHQQIWNLIMIMTMTFWQLQQDYVTLIKIDPITPFSLNLRASRTLTTMARTLHNHNQYLHMHQAHHHNHQHNG